MKVNIHLKPCLFQSGGLQGEPVSPYEMRSE